MLSNEWKPFSLWFFAECASHFLPFGFKLRAALHSFLLCFHPCIVLCFSPFSLPHSSFFERFSVLYKPTGRQQIGSSMWKFYSNKITLILELGHSGWQSAIYSRCTKRSELSMYFSMRDWVRTLQFNSHFNKNTTKINHPWYLRDEELCEHALCGISEHASLTLGANLGVLGWQDG